MKIIRRQTSMQNKETNETSLEETTSTESENTDEEQEKQPVVETADYSPMFGGVKGCAVLYLPQQAAYKIYQEDMTEKEVWQRKLLWKF